MAAPYTAAELAGLRAAAEHTDPGRMTRRLLATIARLEADLAAARTGGRKGGRPSAAVLKDCYRVLARAGCTLRETPSLRHGVLVALAEECETLAAECHAAVEAETPTVSAPPPPRDTERDPLTLVRAHTDRPQLDGEAERPTWPGRQG